MNLRPVDNPPNPYLSQHGEWLEPPPPARIEIYEETSGSILSRNDSPDLPFTWSVNPYRGCQHGCAYCYARPYHEYLGHGAGTDFETKLVVKRNAAELLRREFQKRSWSRELVNFSGVTDCYQPIEAAYGVTRQCLEVCRDMANPVSVVTRGFLVVRDAELLADFHRVAGARVFISIPMIDAELTRLIEPQAPPPARRIEAVRRLSDAGVPVGVLVSPIIPGLNERDIPAVLDQAAKAGAMSATFTALRLPGSVESVFVRRIREVLPLRAERILSRVRDIRSGAMNDSRFGKRMRGQGAYWDTIRDMFLMHRNRLGMDGPGCAEALPMEQAEPDRPAAPTRVQLSFDFGSAERNSTSQAKSSDANPA